jgi:hypothetical protein
LKQIEAQAQQITDEVSLERELTLILGHLDGYCQLKALTGLFFRTSGEERRFFGLFS